MTKSREKGKKGELEAASKIREVFHTEARRGQQFHGGPNSPDIVTGLPGVHFEVKRTETLSLYLAMEQAIRDAAPSETPVVLHRRNKKDWLWICRLEDVPELLQKLTQEEPHETH